MCIVFIEADRKNRAEVQNLNAKLHSILYLFILYKTKDIISI